MTRLRDRQHDLSEQVAIVRYLADQVRELSEDVKELTTQITQIARRVVERPSPQGWSAGVATLSLIVAVVALVMITVH